MSNIHAAWSIKDELRYLDRLYEDHGKTIDGKVVDAANVLYGYIKAFPKRKKWTFLGEKECLYHAKQLLGKLK